MSDILDKILATKRAEIAAGLAGVPLAEMRARAEAAAPRVTSSAPCARSSRPISLRSSPKSRKPARPGG